jgi:hypothetical protein
MHETCIRSGHAPVHRHHPYNAPSGAASAALGAHVNPGSGPAPHAEERAGRADVSGYVDPLRPVRHLRVRGQQRGGQVLWDGRGPCARRLGPIKLAAQLTNPPWSRTATARLASTWQANSTPRAHPRAIASRPDTHSSMSPRSWAWPRPMRALRPAPPASICRHVQPAPHPRRGSPQATGAANRLASARRMRQP